MLTKNIFENNNLLKIIEQKKYIYNTIKYLNVILHENM